MMGACCSLINKPIQLSVQSSTLSAALQHFRKDNQMCNNKVAVRHNDVAKEETE